jgi:hypothetical protein
MLYQSPLYPPPRLPHPPTPTSWPWPSPVLRHIKFAWPMGLSFHWWPTRPSSDTYEARDTSSGGYWLVHIVVPAIFCYFRWICKLPFLIRWRIELEFWWGLHWICTFFLARWPFFYIDPENAWARYRLFNLISWLLIFLHVCIYVRFPIFFIYWWKQCLFP